MPHRYEIVIRGRASDSLLRPLLDDFTVEHTAAGGTRLVGDIIDPAHLHGVLAHLTSVNAEVVSVARCDQPRRTHRIKQTDIDQEGHS